MNKKGFLLYHDSLEVLNDLDDQEAGQLFKMIWQYAKSIQSENPVQPQPPDRTMRLVFAPFKNQMDRDYQKYIDKCNTNRNNGLNGGRPPTTEKTQPDNLAPNRNRKNHDKDTDTDTGTDKEKNTGTDKEKKTTLRKTRLTEVKPSDVPPEEVEYFDLTKRFHGMFMKNLKLKGIPQTNLEKARYGEWVDAIRLLRTTDGYSREQVETIGAFLTRSDFWMTNCQSTMKVREKAQQLLAQAKSIPDTGRGARIEHLMRTANGEE